MNVMEKMNPEDFRKVLPEFEEKTDEFYDGKMSVKDYKGFSGKYGSYAQRGGKKSMLRLRMSAGRITPEKLDFIVEMIKKHHVDLVHFTTCQAVQFHNLDKESVYDIMDKALDVDIVSYGGGGDYPRNVMCSPLAGTDPDEIFNVMPYALKTADFLMHFIDAEKMPRKLKVAFTGSENNLPHATFRDLGFVANEDGTFDVYSAGGLGNNPRLGVLVAEHVPADQILYYVKAMINTFLKYGNYESRPKARTRYMVEKLGSLEAYRDAYREELKRVLESGEDLTLKPEELISCETTKTGDGSRPNESWQILEQKQDGLYTVVWHPVGGSPKPETLEAVAGALAKMKDTEIRLSPDETAYIINLTGAEADQIMDLIADDSAKNDFESSVSCIGSTICQVGLRDSQGLLRQVLKAVKEAGVKDDALPKIYISGCPSSCGTHYAGPIGFRGAIKMVDKKPKEAFILYANGCDELGKEVLGKEIGAIERDQIPEFLIQLARTVEAGNQSFDEWYANNPGAIEELAKPFIG